MKLLSNTISIFSCCLLLTFLLNGCDTKENGFKLCGSGELWPYYHPELKNEQSFYEIKKHYFENYRPILGEKNNGIVKIRFHVNCEGKAGNFTVENYDLNYKTNKLKQEINDQLLNLSKKIDRWIPAKDEKGEVVNSHKFYAFRIENGKLTDILPK